MKTHCRHIISFLLFICLSFSARAGDNFMFKHLEMKDGLSHNQVNSVFKDSRGFMWFSTAGGGLNRFDGYKFDVFRRIEKDPNAIHDSYIYDVQEDVNGNLWVNTGAGYSVFDPIKEVFNNTPRNILQTYGIDAEPHIITIDDKKNMWIHVIGKGVYLYKSKTGQVIHIPLKNNSNVTDIFVGKKDAVFLFNNGELIAIDRNNPENIREDDFIAKNIPLLSEKYELFIDNDDDWWVYSKDSSGVCWYSAKENKWIWLTNTPNAYSPYSLSSNVIQGATQDPVGRIWLATDHGGIDIIDKQKSTITNLQNDITNERSIPSNSINSLYCDDLGIIWLGTYKNGLSYYNEAIYKFAVDHLPEFKHIPNFDSDITVIEEDVHGNIWVGTNGNGLIKIDHVTGKKSIYTHEPNNPNSISSNVIVSLHSAKDGKLWIGTYYGGLECFDGTKFTHHKHNPNNPNSPANDKIWSITEDKKGNIWFGTLGNGVQKYNPAKIEFTSFPNSITSEFISSLCFGNDGTLYIGTAFGIAIYDPKTETFLNINDNMAKTQRFSNQNVNQIYEDSRGLLWIATLYGLNVFDRKKDQITILTTENGLANNIVNGVVEDNNKNMWITTSNGVSNIVVQTDNKTQEHTFFFNNYDELDGLQNRYFNMRSALKSSSGEIFLGGTNGFNRFRPEAIKYNNKPPQVVFTDLTLFNKPVEIDSVYKGNRILEKSFNQTDEIKFKYAQNVFTISFSGMNYMLSEKNKYLYMLEGFSHDWMEVDGETHSVSYTGLPPGTYIFKVRAANSDGFWSNETASMKVVILPPFWRSAWAYVIYSLIIIGLLIFARWSMLRKEREKFRLEQIRQEAEHKHEMDDMKLKFFTNISHEFRTPLTLIITPLQKLIDQTKDEEQKRKLILIRRNGIRLLNLVNQLLDFRKNDVSQHQLNLTNEDLVPFMNNICQSFMELTDRKNISMSFHSSENSIKASFDEDKMEKILMNLLSNAFKFTEEGGSVSVQLKRFDPIGDNDGEIEIRVIDTGKGVSEEDKPHIFERFYQSKNNDLDALSGSGIGLHLVKEFVTLHGGEIRVEDNQQGKGSVFIVSLPLTKEQTVETDEATNTAFNYTTEPVDSETIGETIPVQGEEAPLLMLVEDNHDFRNFMKECLQGLYRIIEAENGQEAWKIIPEMQPDIIISDVMMPEIDGCQLCSTVKNDMRTSHIPVILLTARTAEEHKIEGLETGADDYITKPFNLDILLLRISKLIEIRKKRQDSFSKQIEPQPSDITITSLDEKLIARAIEYVEKNIDRSELSVEELSQELGMSRVHLYKKLTALTGRAPLEFIRVIRLKRAAQLLRESQLNISEIAYSVGFNNPKYFSRYFKEEFNVLPSDYKNQKV